jgi:hypothetical protein
MSMGHPGRTIGFTSSSENSLCSARALALGVLQMGTERSESEHWNPDPLHSGSPLPCGFLLSHPSMAFREIVSCVFLAFFLLFLKWERKKKEREGRGGEGQS